MAEKTLISLSIVSHGDADKVGALLSSIQRYEPGSSKFQIILTDNLGNDLPDFETTPWESLVILRNQKQQGLAYNNNRAFDKSNGKYFAVLNPDLVFESAIFDRLITSLNGHQVDILAPQIIDTDGNIQDSYRPLPSPIELIHRRLPGYRYQRPVNDKNGLAYPDWIAGMFWIMPSSIYRSLNGMDEKFKLYFEDVDFCTRARQQRMKIIVDTNIQVRHDAKHSSRWSAYYLFLHLRSAIQFFSSAVYRQALKINSSN